MRLHSRLCPSCLSTKSAVWLKVGLQGLVARACTAERSCCNLAGGVRASTSAAKATLPRPDGGAGRGAGDLRSLSEQPLMATVAPVAEASRANTQSAESPYMGIGSSRRRPSERSGED